VPFIRKIVKAAVVVLLAFLFCAIMFVGLYDLYEFRPYAGKIEATYRAMDPEDQLPPSNVQSFIGRLTGALSTASPQGICYPSFERRCECLHGTNHSAMWVLMLRLHFDRTKQLSFYCHYLPHENGAGFAKAAQVYFGKHPHELNDGQLATLIAIGRSPSLNSPTRHPESLARAKARLLEAAKTQ
jgi:Transglycosylase